MRVGIDYRPVTAAPLSGIARQVRALEHVLRRRPATEVFLYTTAPLDHPHRAIASCPQTPCPTDGVQRPHHRLRFERSHLPDAIRRDGLDAYVATINMGLPIGRIPSSTRLILNIHDTFQITLRNRHASMLKEWFYRLVDVISIRHSMKVADSIWTASDYSARSLAALFPDATQRIHVLRDAVDASPWRADPVAPMPGLPEKYWLAVGTHEPRKNLRWFVQQWQEAGGVRSLPSLVLVGSASDLPAPLARLDGLRFVDNLSDAQLATLYANALRLWQPSYAEGFGLPVVEAAACGTPVATAKGSALDEVTPPGAPRFDPYDGKALQALMLRLVQGPARAEQESDAALRSWTRQFDLPSYADRVDTLIRGLF